MAKIIKKIFIKLHFLINSVPLPFNEKNIGFVLNEQKYCENELFIKEPDQFKNSTFFMSESLIIVNKRKTSFGLRNNIANSWNKLSTNILSIFGFVVFSWLLRKVQNTWFS